MCNKDLCRSTPAADMSAEYRPICRSTYPPTYRPILGRHIGRECRPTRQPICCDWLSVVYRSTVGVSEYCSPLFC